MHKLVDFICSEIDDLERKVGNEGKLSMTEIEYADKLAHLKKNLLKGEEMMDDGYSNTGDYSNRGYNYRYDDGMTRYSRARGRMNARRDSMGRYSRGRYSMADDEMMSELRELMQDAPDERTRKEFQTFIDKLERM